MVRLKPAATDAKIWSGDLRDAWGVGGEILRCAQNGDVTAKAKAEGDGNGGREGRLEGDAIRAALRCGAARRIFVAAEAATRKANGDSTAKAEGNGERQRRKATANGHG
jgi:hypothetical protein